MKKTLYIVRHAAAEDAGFSSMFKDFDRNLTAKGITQSAKVGRLLVDGKIEIDHFISSPANRAFQTANGILEQLKKAAEVLEKTDSLYGGGPRGYLSTLNSIPEKHSSVAIVGHNPDITFFAEYLTRDDIMGNMKKATFIELVFEDLTWVELSQNTGSVVRRVDVKDINFGADAE